MPGLRTLTCWPYRPAVVVAKRLFATSIRIISWVVKSTIDVSLPCEENALFPLIRTTMSCMSGERLIERRRRNEGSGLNIGVVAQSRVSPRHRRK